MSDLKNAADTWHTEWAKAFITQVSTGEGEYFIKAKFKTVAPKPAYEAVRAFCAEMNATNSTT